MGIPPKSEYRFDIIHEYDDPITGDGQRRLSGHYRIYLRDTGQYLGICIRDDDRRLRLPWRATVPNPNFDATEGPGYRDGRYGGRRVNPKMVIRRAATRGEIADVLARHCRTYPRHRPREARPACERRELVSSAR